MARNCLTKAASLVAGKHVDKLLKGIPMEAYSLNTLMFTSSTLSATKIAMVKPLSIKRGGQTLVILTLNEAEAWILGKIFTLAYHILHCFNYIIGVEPLEPLILSIETVEDLEERLLTYVLSKLVATKTSDTIYIVLYDSPRIADLITRLLSILSPKIIEAKLLVNKLVSLGTGTCVEFNGNLDNMPFLSWFLNALKHSCKTCIKVEFEHDFFDEKCRSCPLLHLATLLLIPVNDLEKRLQLYQEVWTSIETFGKKSRISSCVAAYAISFKRVLDIANYMGLALA